MYIQQGLTHKVHANASAIITRNFHNRLLHLLEYSKVSKALAIQCNQKPLLIMILCALMGVVTH